MTLAAGCFDGLSAPHVRYLQAAKSMDPAAELMVTLVPDRYIRQTKDRDPYWPQLDRAYALCALACVDDVHLQPDGETVPDVIRKLKPRYFVKGPEWKDMLDAAHIRACRDVGTEIRFTSHFGKHWSQVR